jgi:hypothetical protein
LAFYIDGYPDMRQTQKSIAALTALLEKYENSVPFTIDITADLMKAAACDFEIYGKVAHQGIKCPSESMAFSDTAVTFPKIANTGGCMDVNLRG